MDNWCHYSDMPSPSWWDKRTGILEKLAVDTRPEFLRDIEVIIGLASDEELEKLEILLGGNYSPNLIYIELDFIATRLAYFCKFPEGHKTSFGMDFRDVPELIAKWRDEKLGGLGI